MHIRIVHVALIPTLIGFIVLSTFTSSHSDRRCQLARNLVYLTLADELTSAFPGLPELLPHGIGVRLLATQERGCSVERGLAFVYAVQGDENRALSYWDDVPGDSSELLKYYGTRARQLGDREQSFRWYRWAAELHPAAVEDELYALGLSDRRSGDWESAREVFSVGARFYPENGDFWYQLAQAQLRTNEYEVATASLQKGIMSTYGEVGKSNFYYALGYHKHNRLRPKDINGAVESYQHALALDQFEPYENVKANTLFELGKIYQSWDEPRLAQELFENALDVNPDYYSAMVVLGYLLLDEDAYDGALDLATRAIKLDEQDKRAYLLLGEVYRAQERLDAALNVYLRVLEIEPGNSMIIETMKELKGLINE